MNANGLNYPSLTAAILATMLPFIAFVIIMVLTRKNPRLSARLSIAAVSISLISAFFLLFRHWQLESPLEFTGRWLISA